MFADWNSTGRAGEETGDGALPWKVGRRDDAEPVNEYFRALIADGNRSASCRSYAYDLLRWLRFLGGDGPWRTTRIRGRRYVLVATPFCD